jgi:hypothetical protein
MTTSTCYNCEEFTRDYIYINDELICLKCRDEHYYECYRCGDLYHEDDLIYCEHDNRYCPNCSCDSDNNEHIPYRATDESTEKYIGQRRGSIVKSLRVFGIEIECYPEQGSASSVLDNMPQGVGFGSDLSLGNGGIEIRTPRVAGSKGEALIRRIVSILDEYHTRVDRLCGLHLHLDTIDMDQGDVTELRMLFALYLAFEDVMFSFLPSSRRGNRYCKALRRYFHAEEILGANTREKLESIWYRAKQTEEVQKLKDIKIHESRYIGLNLHSLFHANHAEIRYHSGTVNVDKILQWVNLHALLFDKAKEPYARGVVEQGLNEVRLERKTEDLFDFLSLSNTSRAYFLKRQSLFNNNKTN